MENLDLNKMANLKVLHVVSSYWPAFEFGGPIASVHTMNKFLARAGADVTVYTTDAGLKQDKEIAPEKENILDGVKVFYFPSYGYIHWNFSPDLFFKLRKNIKNFDIIQITGVWNFPVFAAAFWARFYGKPYVISPRGSLMEKPLMEKSQLIKKIYLALISKRDMQKASVVHFTTGPEEIDYLNAGLSLKKSVIIPNGIDPEELRVKRGTVSFRKKFNIANNKKIILFMGRLNWIKGFGILIPAFAEVVKKNSNAVLVISGSDSAGYSKTVKSLVEQYRLIRNVIFTGILEGNEKNMAYSAADIFVLPSYSENFGMVLAEAMHFGLPVITTKYVGIAPEILKNEAGIVIDKNAGELAGAILNILDNKILAEKLAKNGEKLVKEKFLASAVADKFMKLYNEITGHGK